MPSPSHQHFIFVLREHPELVVELARRAGIPIPAGDRPVVDAGAEFDIPVAVGRTLRADLALASHEPGRAEIAADGPPDAAADDDGGGEPCGWALAVEVLLNRDRSKRWTIPHYRSGLAYNLRCPTQTLVFSPDPRVRRSIWAMFADGWVQPPAVVEPSMLPPIRDLAAAIAAVGHAVLATTLHADHPEIQVIAKVALLAVLRAAPREPSRYVQLVANAIGAETMNQIIAELPEQDREPLSEWERRGASFVRGKAEGVEEGIEKGIEEAREKAQATLLAILTDRGLAPTPELHARLEAADLDQLNALTRRAATVRTVAELLPGPER